MKCWYGLLVGALVATAALPAAAEPAYRGVKACKKCHLKQYKSWNKTSMAKSFDLLSAGVKAEEKEAAGLDPDKDYTTDTECLGCHTTGYGKPGGYGSGGKDEYLTGVGCEMCHGAAGDYLKKELHSNKNKHFKRATLESLGYLGVPKKEQCTNCHNDDSPFFESFDFDARKDDGTHEHFKLKYDH